MKKSLSLLAGLLISPMLFSADLLDVYQQARLTNPTLKASEATRDAAYASINISRANLLPQLGLNANYAYGSGFRDADGVHSKNGTLSLGLQQSLFNYSAWKGFDMSQKQASIQDIAYQAQEQVFIVTIANAYFNVLTALDNLEYTRAQMNAFRRQMDEAKQKFDVGLVAITDVQNAKANYDLTRAELVSSINALDNAVESLREQSGVFYDTLATVNTDRFKTEKPDSVNNLLTLAKSNNLQLIASRLSMELAQENIRLAEAGHLPTLSLQASSALAKSQNYGTDLVPGAGYISSNTINGQNQIGIYLTIPLFSGGGVSAQVEKAQYDYANYTQQLEVSDRSVVNNVSSYYNNVIASMTAISAYEQAVTSAQSSLNATESGYNVGTRTIVDVLNATTQLYSSLKNLSNARYNYLLSVLQLKLATGSLTAEDLAPINAMLGSEKSLSENLTSL